MAGYRRFLSTDGDYDWAFILRLLEFKLERTRKCILKGHAVLGERRKIARQIRSVEEHLSRVTDDSYFETISRGFTRRYGQLRMVTGKTLPGSPGVPVTFRFDKETPRNKDRIRREWRALHAKAEKMQKEDLRLAFEKMLREIWGWWD